MSLKTKFDVVKFLANLIFKKEIQKQKGIMKILPGAKVDAEEKAKFALKKLQERANINTDNLTKSDLEFIAQGIANPFKYGEKTVVKSADILPFRFKRSFAEELADASKKGDFTRMSGIMKLDPKFKEVMKAFKKSKADKEAYEKMVGPKKLIPDRDVIPYQSPEIAKLKGAERMNYLITSPEQTAKLLKKGVTSDDIIYAQDRYGMTAKDMIDAVDAGFKFPFADGGVAGMLGERQNFAMGRRAFMKLLGGVGAGIGALKTGAFKLFSKEGATVAKEVITTPAAAGKPAWFDALVTRVINEGDDVTKKFATKEREIVHLKKIDEDATVTVTRDLDSGTVRVDIDDPFTNVADEQGNAIVSMEVRGGQLEQGVKGKTPAEFQAVETDYGNYLDRGGDDYTTEVVENVVKDTKDLTADLTKVKMYAKGQKKPTIKEMMIQRERAKNLKLAEENPTEYASGRQPDIDYASGGLARMLGE